MSKSRLQCEGKNTLDLQFCAFFLEPVSLYEYIVNIFPLKVTDNGLHLHVQDDDDYCILVFTV